MFTVVIDSGIDMEVSYCCSLRLFELALVVIKSRNHRSKYLRKEICSLFPRLESCKHLLLRVSEYLVESIAYHRAHNYM